MENKILPTVGRMVYYKSYGTPNGEFPSVDRAATITEVIDAEAGIVSLCIMNPTGLFFNQSVKQGQEPGQWDWMPFQKDQQARLAKEEAEKETPAQPEQPASDGGEVAGPADQGGEVASGGEEAAV